MNQEIVVLYSDTARQEELAQDLIKQNFEVHKVSTLTEFDTFVKAPKGALILVQSDIGFIDVEALCTRLKSNSALKNMPVLFVSNHADDIDELVKCFDACADDYIKYPPLALELLKRIEYHLKSMQKRKELEDKSKRLATLASNDPLTKVASKVSVQSTLEQGIKYLYKQSSKDLVVVYVHVGNLTKVNELLGFEKGDKYLVHIANMLQKNLNAYSSIGRWVGGDFVLILQQSSINEAKALVHEIFSLIKQDGIIKRFKTKFYFGITKAKEHEHAQTLIERAREAMAQASNGEESYFWVA